ncbi:MAG: Na+/H+ antiporter subunit E [Chloroflexi bacterium]|nr:Na+/H+ antiporter subunit E [Chloroflexota bacterium]
MIGTALLAVPLALIWMLLNNHITLDSFLIGYLLGALVAYASGAGQASVRLATLPRQLAALLVYCVVLARDIFLSGVDVARKVLNPRSLRPGIIAVDPLDRGSFYAALSAHSITITPGQLVVEFDSENTMYVHCLDVEASDGTVERDQRKRLGLFKRILGDG